MMARPIAEYLVHFATPDNGAFRGETSLGDSFADLLEEPPAADPEAAIEAARDEGLADGIASADKKWEARLAQERQGFELRLAAERDSWAREESEKLGEKIQAAFATIESNIAECVARILKPFVIESARAKIADLLAENIGVLLRGQKAPMLAIAGPEDLLTALRERLTPLSAEIEYFLNEDVDVQIAAGDTLIESQLAAFASRINTYEA